MAYIQSASPPPTAIEYFAISDFSGGLNNRDAYMEIAQNESINLLNVDIFRENGVVWQRGGTYYKDAIDLGSPITLLDVFKRPVGDKVIRASDSELYADAVLVKALSGRAQGVIFGDKYVFADGGGLWSYGSFPQLSNTYTSIIGTPTTDDIVMEIAGEQSGYTPLDSTYDIGVTVYDYTARKVYYNPCENELNDYSKGANFQASTPTCLDTKEGRLYVAGDTDLPYSVFISDIQNPYYYPVSVGLQISPRGDKITTLVEFHEVMIIGTTERFHAVYGNTNRTDLDYDLFYMKDLNVHTGIANPNTAVRVNNYLYYLGSDGEVYSMYTPQTDTTKIMTVILTRKLRIFEEPLNVDTSVFANACAVFHRDYYWLSLGDKILVYSYTMQAWTVYDSINATSFDVQGYMLQIGNTSGRVVTYDRDELNDLDLAISAYWKSKRFAMGYPSRIKKFKSMYVIVHTFATFDSTINISFEVDYEDIESIATVKNQISRWGTAVFGDRFITRNINKSLPININRRGRLISFTFANNIVDESMRVYEVNGEYEVRGFR